MNQPVHWFLKGKGLGIQQETSIWVGSPRSESTTPRVCGGLYVNNLLTVGLPNCSGEWLGVDISIDTRRSCLKKYLDYMLKFTIHSRCNSQHDWGNDMNILQLGRSLL